MKSIWCGTLLLPSLMLAQTGDTAINQRILEELKGIRASLARLEKSHQALLSLNRMDGDEKRLETLEERRQRVSKQEQEMADKIAAANRAIESSAGVSGEGVDQSLARAEAGLARSFVEQSARTLKELARSREALDQEIARLKARISVVEKHLEDALR